MFDLFLFPHACPRRLDKRLHGTLVVGVTCGCLLHTCSIQEPGLHPLPHPPHYLMPEGSHSCLAGTSLFLLPLISSIISFHDRYLLRSISLVGKLFGKRQWLGEGVRKRQGDRPDQTSLCGPNMCDRSFLPVYKTLSLPVCLYVPSLLPSPSTTFLGGRQAGHQWEAFGGKRHSATSGTGGTGWPTGHGACNLPSTFLMVCHLRDSCGRTMLW